ncbi:MAG: carboxyl transferase domain-containing protein [Oscillospiraceae bacterium]
MSKTSNKGTASDRLKLLFDDGNFVEIDSAAGKDSGSVAGYGSVGGATVFAFCQDSSTKSGAVDTAMSRKLSKVCDLAAKTGSPIITIYDSKGVKFDNGFASLEASSEILRKTSELSGVVPQIAVVVGTCAGFSAMCAAMADVCIMSKDAELFNTAPFIDKANGGAEKNVGDAEFALKSGVAAVICDDENAAIAKAVEIAKMLPLNNLAALPVYDFEAPKNPNAECLIERYFDADSAIALFDGVGKHSAAALATIGGMPCGVATVFGRMCRHDTAKIAKLVELCDSFNLPIFTFVDSEGFVLSAENDRMGGIRSGARLAQVLAEATTAKICVVTGKAIGSMFTVFGGRNAGSDVTYAWPTAVISPIHQNAAAELLCNDRIKKNDDIAALAEEYSKTVACAQEAAKAGLIDALVAPETTREALISAVDMLASKRVSRLPKKHGNMPL